MLKPYRLDQGEFLSPLELALDHDVEIEEAGAKLGGRYRKCWEENEFVNVSFYVPKHRSSCC